MGPQVCGQLTETSKYALGHTLQLSRPASVHHPLALYQPNQPPARSPAAPDGRLVQRAVAGAHRDVCGSLVPARQRARCNREQGNGGRG